MHVKKNMGKQKELVCKLGNNVNYFCLFKVSIVFSNIVS